MKTLRIYLTIALLSLGMTLSASDIQPERLNLPGDNLNLYAVMKLFQESETLEGFERSLNSEDSKINNLDLNGDNYIDYIKVIDYVDGEDHTIVLQVAINERENQDVAVITVFKDKYGQVTVQMIGDEYLYGKNYIIEPYYAETPNPGYTGAQKQVRTETVVVNRTTYVEVVSWPVIRYIYAPVYVGWRSPWYWGYYPSYWRPWRAYYWDYYYGYHAHWYNYYYNHFRYCDHYRYPRYRDHYYHRHRVYSTTVRTYRDEGRYNYTYSRPDLRSEGSAEYQRRHGNPGRGSGATDVNNPGRNAQVGSDTPARTSTPVISPRGSSSTGRTSKPDTEVKSKSAAPVTTGGRTANPGNNGVNRQEKKGEPARPSVTARTSSPEVGTPRYQNEKRSEAGRETREQPGRSTVAPRTSKPEVGTPRNQNEKRAEVGPEAKDQPGRIVVAPRTSKPEVGSRSSRSSAKQVSPSGTSRSGSARSAVTPKASRSDSKAVSRPSASKSAPASVDRPAKSSSSKEVSGNTGRSPATSGKSNSGR
jgi:hypothetical protein